MYKAAYQEHKLSKYMYIFFITFWWSVPCNTSSVEKGYLYVEMICSPRINILKPEHLETILVSNVKNLIKRIVWLFKRNGTFGKLLKTFTQTDVFCTSGAGYMRVCTSVYAHFDVWSNLRTLKERCLFWIWSYFAPFSNLWWRHKLSKIVLLYYGKAHVSKL